MAEQIWPGESAVGKRVRVGGDADAPWTTVVGVVGRVKQYALDSDSRIAMYFAHTQFPTRAMNIVRRARAPRPMHSPRRCGRRCRRSIAICRSTTCGRWQRASSESLARRRFSMLLLTLFAALALGLAAIGTVQRDGLPGQPGDARAGDSDRARRDTPAHPVMVVGHGMFLATVGAIAGVAGAFAMTRLVRTLLFGVESTDPVTFASVIALLAAVALVASGLPARRAARVDPVAVLRGE